MKINFFNCSNTNFGSKTLYSAKVQQRFHDCGEFFPLDVYITKLDTEDIPKLKRDERDWEDTIYGKNLIEAAETIYPEVQSFLKDKTSVYAIEVPSKYGERQIRALASVVDKDKGKKVYLDYIQVNNCECMPNVLKGGGSCLLYAAIDHARQIQADTFSLCSNSNAKKFYRRNGLTPIINGDDDFKLDKKNFDKRLKILEKKYSIKKQDKNENTVNK